MRKSNRRWLPILLPALYVAYALRPVPTDLAFLQRGTPSLFLPVSRQYPYFMGTRLPYPHDRYWNFPDGSSLPVQIQAHLTEAKGWEAFDTRRTNIGHTDSKDTWNPRYDIQTVVNYVHKPTGVYLVFNRRLGPEGKETCSVYLFEPQGAAAIIDRVKAVPWCLVHPFSR